MAVQVQRRGGTTDQHSTFKGANREITVDTTKKTLVVHDGQKQAGYPIAREDLSNVSKETVLSKISAQNIFLTACPTGVVFSYAGQTPPEGFLLLNGQTIGSFGSSADNMGEEYKTLYEFLWSNMSDEQVSVDGGRGASALDDWDAWKKLTIPDARSRFILGADQGAGLTNRILGSVAGEERHKLSIEELPKHRHYMGTILSDAGSSNDGPNGASDGTYPDRWTEYEGADIPHNNMPPWLALTWIIKY